MKRSRRAKSSSVQGASRLAWIMQQAQRAVKHAQGKGPLLSGDLVVVKFHGVDGAAAVLVILGVGAEDAGQQDPGASAFGVRNQIEIHSKLLKCVSEDKEHEPPPLLPGEVASMNR